MKNQLWGSGILTILLSTLLSGCEVIGGIFKAGVWSGILLIVLGIAAIIFIATKLLGKKD